MHENEGERERDREVYRTAGEDWVARRKLLRPGVTLIRRVQILWLGDYLCLDKLISQRGCYTRHAELPLLCHRDVY